MKIRPVGAKLFHTDRSTEMTQLIVAFRNFENAPKNMSLKRKTILPKIYVPDCIVIKESC